MVCMSTSIASVRIDALLRHAATADIGEVGIDQEHANRFFIDICLRFKEERLLPFVDRNHSQTQNDIVNALSRAPPPRKIVSILSDDGALVSQRVEHITTNSSSDRTGSMSDSFPDDDFSRPKSGSTRNDARQLPVCLPDVARTTAISTFSKKQTSSDATNEERSVTNIVCIRDEIRAVEHTNRFDFDKHEDVAGNIQSGLIPPPTQTPRDAGSSKDGNCCTGKESFGEKESTEQDKRTCTVSRKIRFEDENDIEIKPNPPKHVPQPRHIYLSEPLIAHIISSGIDPNPMDERGGAVTGCLLRRTSNLARNMMHKFRSRNRNAAGRTSAAKEGKTEGSKGSRWHTKFSSWFCMNCSEDQQKRSKVEMMFPNQRTGQTSSWTLLEL